MLVFFLIVICFLSVLPFSQILGKNIILYKKYISYSILALSFLSPLLLLLHIPTIQTGIYALELLWFLLWLPILAKVFGLSIAQKLMLFRKEIGIWMGIMATVHMTQYFIWPFAKMPWEKLFWIENNTITFVSLGLLTMLITIPLTLTSNNYSLKKLGKYWKYLHRSVYILIIIVLLHVAIFKVSHARGGETNIFLVILTTFIPFFLYFTGKILEWKKIKIPLDFKKVLAASIIIGAILLIGRFSGIIGGDIQKKGPPNRGENFIQEQGSFGERPLK